MIVRGSVLVSSILAAEATVRTPHCHFSKIAVNTLLVVGELVM